MFQLPLSSIFQNASSVQPVTGAAPHLYPDNSPGRRPSSSAHALTHDQDWQASFHIRSRADALKASAVLARAIHLDHIAENGLSVAIMGPMRSGKSLIFDTIAHTLSLDKNAYTEPASAHMYLEKKSDEALNNTVTGTFSSQRGQIDIAFRNFVDLDNTIAQSMKKPETLSLFSFNHLPDSRPISEIAAQTDADIMIKIRTSLTLWHDHWDIYIAPSQRSPEMQRGLDQLKDMAARRAARGIEPPELL